MGHVFGDQLVSIEFHCVNIGTYSPAMDTWFGDRKKVELNLCVVIMGITLPKTVHKGRTRRTNDSAPMVTWNLSFLTTPVGYCVWF